MPLRKLAVIGLAAVYAASCSPRVEYEYAFQNPDLPVEKRVDDLIGRLTTDEKISQMMNQTPAIERLGIPPYDWWNEALHGVARAGKATVFPQAIAMAATFSDDDILETFDIISDEARAKYHQFQRDSSYRRYTGLTFWTPNINIFRDPRWGRGMETYGEDPFLTSRIGVAAVKGLQGDDPHYLKTHACAKHYAVHSGPEWNRHEFNVSVSPRDLWTTYLPAFEALVKEADVQEVMCAYNRYEGQPCCGNNKLLNDILRNDWGYQNIVVSDCGAIDDFWKRDERKPRHETHPDAATASADAVLKGTDIECGSSYKALKEALETGKITEADLDKSLRRLFRGRFELGMFDPIERIPYADIPYSVVESPEHVAKSLDMARKSMVLLSNRNNTLPLSRELRRIAVVGPNADDSTMLWSNYNGTPTHTVTILEGIRNKMPEAEIIYDKGCGHTQRLSPDFSATIDKVEDADVIIFVSGLSPRLEGEEMAVNAEGFKRGDRLNIEVPAVQRELAEALKATGKPVVNVVCTGSALALKWEDANLDAILNAWYGGQEAGTAVADILFGDYNPSGRLPVTFYASTDQLPDFENYDMYDRTYRYMTQKPLYPFGYGLSYSDFEYGRATLSKKKIGKGKPVEISFTISNTGDMDGDEIAQVYVVNPNDKQGPVKSLCGFERVTVPAGGTASVSITIEPEAFYSFNDRTRQREIRPGEYRLLYGSSSDDKDLKSVDLTIR